jgi:hypothetical protein
VFSFWFVKAYGRAGRHPEEGDSMFIRNVGICVPTIPQDVTTKKINIDIFAAVRTSYLQ